METAAGDSIPFLEQTTEFITRLITRTDEWFLKAFPESWSPVLPVGEKDYVRIRQKDRLLPTPEIYHPDKIRKQMVQAASYYEKTAGRWPGVRFYVFAIPRQENGLVETGIWSGIPGRLLLGRRAVNDFESFLPERVAYSWAFKGHPAEETFDFYFKTDHHLTMPGTYEAYCQLHHLISSRGVNLGKAVRCREWFVVPRVTFRGSRSRMSGSYEKPTDELIDGIFDLPDYRVILHGSKPLQDRNNRSEYQANTAPFRRFTNHYREYFGHDRGLMEYITDQAPEGSHLLVIGDSFKNAMEPLLAVHFRRSYFVDLRYFHEETGRGFVLDAFISQYGITDVLFIGSERTVISDPEADQTVQEKAD